jgi:hypothetical protein
MDFFAFFVSKPDETDFPVDWDDGGSGNSPCTIA